MPVTTTWTAETISLHSARLESYFHRDRVRIPCDTLAPVNVSVDLHPYLTSWISGTSRLFWVNGPPIEAEDYDNPVTMLATWLVHLAAQAGFPTLSYFCELRRGEPLRRGNTWGAQSLVAVAMGVLRQMVELLLPRFEAEVDLSEARFRLLDGTLASWGEAMGLLEELGKLMPPGVICVVDGLHWVDDDTTDVYLGELIGALRRCGFKVLLTTSGRAPGLLDLIDESEVLDLEALDSGLEITGMGGDIFDT